MYGIVYKAQNKINGKCYIGQTTQTFHVRRLAHFSDSRNKKKDTKCCRVFCDALRKYGEEGFDWEILEECEAEDPELLTKMEAKYMKMYKGLVPDGYNLREAGSKGKASEESKAKMSASHMGNKSNTGKKYGPERCRQISERLKGNQYRKGIPHPPEVKAILRENATGNQYATRRKVIDSDGRVYQSTKEAREAHGIHKSSLRVSIVENRPMKSLGKQFWYLTDDGNKSNL